MGCCGEAKPEGRGESRERKPPARGCLATTASLTTTNSTLTTLCFVGDLHSLVLQMAKQKGGQGVMSYRDTQNK